MVIHGKSFLQILDKLFDTATKTELDPVKTASKEVVYKTEVTVELIGNKTDEKKKWNQNICDMDSIHVGEIIISPEKRQQILNELR